MMFFAAWFCETFLETFGPFAQMPADFALVQIFAGTDGGWYVPRSVVHDQVDAICEIIAAIMPPLPACFLPFSNMLWPEERFLARRVPPYVYFLSSEGSCYGSEVGLCNAGLFHYIYPMDLPISISFSNQLFACFLHLQHVLPCVDRNSPAVFASIQSMRLALQEPADCSEVRRWQTALSTSGFQFLPDLRSRCTSAGRAPDLFPLN